MNGQSDIPGLPPPAFAPSKMFSGTDADSTQWRNYSVIVRSVTVNRSLAEDPGFFTKPEPALGIQGEVPLTLEIKNENGTKAALTGLPFEIDLNPTGDMTLKSRRGNGPWQLSLSIDSAGQRMDLQFTLNCSGLSVEEALEASGFYLVLACGGEIRLVGRHPITGGELMILRSRFPAGAVEVPNQRFMRMLDNLAFIQDQTGESFRIPKGEISFEDVITIEATAHILKTGRATYKAEPWVSISNLEQARHALDIYEGGRPALMAAHFNSQIVVIFGTHVPLGPVTFFCDQTIITDEDLRALKSEVENQPFKSKFRIHFTPVEGCPVEARYIGWLPKEEAAAMRQLPMSEHEGLQLDEEVRGLPPGNPEDAIALLESWYGEDQQEQAETWEHLKIALDEDRLSDRKLFP